MWWSEETGKSTGLLGGNKPQMSQIYADEDEKMRKARRKSVVLILAGLFLFFASYLLISENPWSFDKEILSKIEAGEAVKLKFQVALGLYLAAAVNLILCTGLLVAWWFFDARLGEPDRGISMGEGEAEQNVVEASGLGARGFYILLLLIVILGGGLRWHLANGSLWWDELWSVKQAVVGAYVPEKKEEGEYKFKEVSWERSAWYYRKPTNHAVASLSAKVVDSVWRRFSDAEPQEFHDFLIRLPMWLCSLLVIFMMGVLGRKWKMPWAGLAAALLLALHPWHVRYGVDVRAYTFVVLWAVMGCYWLTCIAESKNRSFFPWFMFGLNQFLLVWSFLLALWLAAGFFVAAVVLVFMTWRKRADRLTAWWSLFLVNVLGGMFFIQVFAPNLIQMKVWVPKEQAQLSGHELNAARFQEFLSQAFFGMPLSRSTEGVEVAGLASFAGQMQQHSWWMWSAMVVLGLAGVLGFLYLLYVRRRVLVVMGAVLVGGVFAMGFYALVDTYFFHRFVIFLIVPIVFMPAFALQWGVSMCLKPSRTLAGVAGLLILAALYVPMVWPQLKVLNERSYAPLREVAEYFQQQRGGLFSDPEKGKPALLVAVYGHGGETMHVYDPEVKVLRSFQELKDLVKLAQQSGSRLLVAYDHRHFNQVMVPGGIEYLHDSKQFKEVATYPAIEPEFFFRILEYTGG
ncbi:MAG: hypothetical protein L3J39_01910 [Verrucomicrobiales bacterium]|nr:hypothetical protein [Verrucomicrobiales bacterium]